MQKEVVHQAVILLPLQEIINKSSPGDRAIWEKNLKNFAQHIPDEAMEVSMAGEHSSQNHNRHMGILNRMAVGEHLHMASTLQCTS